ncbi:unnamed protein product [Durusdinium trenchii]|uniref:Uncharacterized protein n=1 Tax=Durusdinium trenchii TaxID=1381693 RepID=A0ABP0KCR6_9DINO
MSGYASRTEIQQLEARLLQAEKELQIQGQNMQLLQAQLETLLGPQQGLYQTAVTTPVATALRERSRTPTPLSGVLARGAVFPGMWEHTPVAAVVPAASEITGGLLGVQQFIAQNQLDEKCIEALTTQPPEVQTHVINQGPAEGRNPSAMVMGRIAKAQRELESHASPDLQAQVEAFIAENALDAKCSEALRSQSQTCQVAVISGGPAAGRNASAMVMSRINKFIRAGGI